MQAFLRNCLTACLGVCVALSSLMLSAAEAGRDFKQILASGELRVAVTLDQPWVMKNGEGELVGAEIDIARRIAKDMNLAVKFSLVDEWGELVPALTQGEVDVVISGLGITPARALQVNFTKPYRSSGVGLATNTKLTENIASLEELKTPETRIALVNGTISAEVGKRVFTNATLKMYPNFADAGKALRKGEVQALVASNPKPHFLSLTYPSKIDVPLSKPLLSFPEAMALRKGDIDFLNFLDSWLVARNADGWIASTNDYWFASLRWQDDIK